MIFEMACLPCLTFEMACLHCEGKGKSFLTRWEPLYIANKIREDQVQ